MLLATEDGLKPSETGLNSFIRLEWRLVLSHKLEAILLVLTDEELLDATLFDATEPTEASERLSRSEENLRRFGSYPCRVRSPIIQLLL